jgi:hypothetical protein
MQSKIAFGILSLATAGGLFLGSPANADQAMVSGQHPSACAVVAMAKYQQWVQPKLMIVQTNTFGDGSRKGMQLIVTQDSAYARFGSLWHSANVTRGERGVANPALLATKMGLASCEKGGGVQEAGAPATVYTYSYAPDSNGTVSKGTIWLSDATGLPLRQEFEQAGPLANSRVAATIETTYAYNDDVTVPHGAELAENTRLFRNRQPFYYNGSAFADGAR